MAKAPIEGIQTAQCTRCKEYRRKDGELHERYVFLLEGKEFTVFDSDYFKAEVGKYYKPVIDVIPTVYTDREGRSRAQNSPIVNWVEA